MEYFCEKYNFHLLKNYILKDPLSDWFNIQEYINNNYERDDTSYYKDYILRESKNYKENFLKNIMERSGYDIPLNTSIDETKE